MLEVALLKLQVQPGDNNEHYPVKIEGRVVGNVTSGTMSPSLKVGIALAYVDAKLETGTNVMLEIRGSDVPAQIVETVFIPRDTPGQ